MPTPPSAGWRARWPIQPRSSAPCRPLRPKRRPMALIRRGSLALKIGSEGAIRCGARLVLASCWPWGHRRLTSSSLVVARWTTISAQHLSPPICPSFWLWSACGTTKSAATPPAPCCPMTSACRACPPICSSWKWKVTASAWRWTALICPMRQAPWSGESRARTASTPFTN